MTAEDAATKDQKVSLLAWTIAGSAMPVPAFVFQCLATRKPDLDVESARTRRATTSASIEVVPIVVSIAIGALTGLISLLTGAIAI